MKGGWLLIIVIAVVFYLAGVKYPATGQNLLSKAGL